MSVRIGDWQFDHVHYDAEADVLYLSIGPARHAIGEETPEGHILRFDEASGEFCGVTIIDARRIREADGRIDVTVPSRERVDLRGLELEPEPA